jgi:hypothetical protein
MARQPRLDSVEERAVLDHLQTEHHRRTYHKPEVAKRRLSAPQCASALAIFVGWLLLFAAGIVVDTKPYRTAISPTAAALLETDNQAAATSAATAAPVDSPSKVAAWLVVVTCFLPLNLAWVCALASALGAFGNAANLADDGSTSRSRDTSNPFLSAVLRGFFVYLFMMSGLLLLDEAPFTHPTPEQYIRLGGFLSLFSFVVSYQPRLFNILIVWAFHRISVREGEEADAHSGDSSTIYAKQTTLEVAATRGPAANPHLADSPESTKAPT